MLSKDTPPEMLDALNDPQWEAVQHGEGPLLILAGAGSGKTRVITCRIAYLILEEGVDPAEILAVTFTNKAAEEMRERVAGILERAGRPEAAEAPTISTFHSLGARILRQRGDALGLDWNFSILDQDDQLQAIEETTERGDAPDWSPDRSERKELRRYIESMKNKGLSPRQAHERTRGPDEERRAAFYEAYQNYIRSRNSADFGELLYGVLELFRDHPDLAEAYGMRWRYVMVDEFQDTNPAQYELLEHLCTGHRNLAVVGDDDQAIYRWRGATVANILDFEEDFEETHVVKLEQNYRSSQRILDAAHDVIEHLPNRRAKKLWTERDAGESITVFTGSDDREEAQYVARTIDQKVRAGAEYRDVAVFYRLNSQSRQLEEKLRARGVPYRVVGGTSFYARKEIKDVMAYLTVAMNPADDVSCVRVVGTPKRGVGGRTVEKLRAGAQVDGIDSIFGAIRYALELTGRAGIGLEPIDPKPRDEGDWEALETLDGLGGRPKGGLREFARLIIDLREDIAGGKALGEVASHLVDRINYREYLEGQDAEKAKDRKRNVGELLQAIEEFEADQQDDDGRGEAAPDPEAIAERAPDDLLAQSEGGARLQAFLEESTLVQDAESEGERGDDVVTLMTVHGAKGLEFDTVFLAGMEDELFPYVRDDFDEAELREERRLAYVAITRAERKLYITNAKRRQRWGNTKRTRPSRFLLDIDRERLEIDGRSSADEVEYRSRRKRGTSWGRGNGDDSAGGGWAGWDQSGADAQGSYGRAVAEAADARDSEDDEDAYFSQVDPTVDEAVYADEAWEEDENAAGQPEAQNDDQKEEGGLVGATVTHSRFGIGRVESVSGSGDDAKLTIHFPQHGEQTIVRKYLKVL